MLSLSINISFHTSLLSTYSLLVWVVEGGEPRRQSWCGWMWEERGKSGMIHKRKVGVFVQNRQASAVASPRGNGWVRTPHFCSNPPDICVILRKSDVDVDVDVGLYMGGPMAHACLARLCFYSSIQQCNLEFYILAGDATLEPSMHIAFQKKQIHGLTIGWCQIERPTIMSGLLRKMDA